MGTFCESRLHWQLLCICSLSRPSALLTLLQGSCWSVYGQACVAVRILTPSSSTNTSRPIHRAAGRQASAIWNEFVAQCARIELKRTSWRRPSTIVSQGAASSLHQIRPEKESSLFQIASIPLVSAPSSMLDHLGGFTNDPRSLKLKSKRDLSNYLEKDCHIAR